MRPDGLPQRIVVVGGGLAGLRVAEGLATKGENLHVTLVGDEPYLPYNRPPLTKSEWQGLEFSSLSFSRKSAAQFDLHVGVRIAHLDPVAGTAVAEDGKKFFFDTAVVATGLVPRRAVTTDSHSGAALRNSVALRTFDDHLTVQRALRRGHHVAILGAGFIGCELASSLSKAGYRVTLFGRQTLPLVERLGYRISERLRGLILDTGLDYVTGRTPIGAHKQDEHLVLELSDGSTTRADLLIEALGSKPDLSFWGGASPHGGQGLHVNSNMKVIGTDNIYAVGDIAEFDIAGNGHRRRHEHWATAVDTARIAVDAITSQGTTVPSFIPSSWSDQFGHRIQTLGLRATDSAELDLSDDPRSGRFRNGEIVTGFVSQGQLTGVVALSPLGQPSPAIAWRKEIAVSFNQSTLWPISEAYDRLSPAQPQRP